MRSVRTGEVIVDEEFFRLAPDGTRRSFSWRCTPFHHDREGIAGAVLVARDITAQKRSQDQLAYLWGCSTTPRMGSSRSIRSGV